VLADAAVDCLACVCTDQLQIVTYQFVPNLNNRVTRYAITYLPESVDYKERIMHALFGWRSAVKILVTTAVSAIVEDPFFASHNALFPQFDFFVELFGLVCFTMVAQRAVSETARSIGAIIVSFKDERSPRILCGYVNQNTEDDHSRHAETRCCRHLDKEKIDTNRVYVNELES
jgi:hypothetical protein